MSRNKIFDFLIVMLVYLAFSCFPFELFIKGDAWIIDVCRIGVQIGLIIFDILYLKYRSCLDIKLNKTNFKNLLLLLPCVIVCFSNFLYFAFEPQQFGMNFQNEALLYVGLYALVATNEEIIFRLCFFNNVNNKNSLKTILIGAGIFGLCHLTGFISNPTDPSLLLVVLYTFAFGILLSIGYVSTNSLWFTIILHFIFNTCNDVLYESMSLGIDSWLYYILANGIVVVVVGLYLVYLVFGYKILKPKTTEIED